MVKNKRFQWVVGALIFVLMAPPLAAAPPPAPAFMLERYDTLVSEAWYNVLFGGAKIGFSHTRIEKGKNGFRITNRAVIRMTVQEMTRDLSYTQTYFLDPNRRAVGFSTLQKVGPQRQKTVGQLIGGIMEMTVTGAGGTRKVTKKVPENIAFIETLGFALAHELRPGYNRNIPVFVTSLRAVDTFNIKVTGHRKELLDGVAEDIYEIEATIHGFTTRSELTGDGVVVSEFEGSLGVRTVRATEESALAFSSAGVPVTSLITFSLIRPNRPIPDQEELKTLAMVIGGLDNPRAIPRDDRQTMGKPLWSEGPGGERVMSLPVTLNRQEPDESVLLREAKRGAAEYLADTPEIQATNPMIRTLAKNIVGKETSVYRAAKKINRWVYENLEKKLSDSFSALDALNAREGECQAHTNLFTALARSVGIPARVVAGVVHSPKEKGFLYHAWPEVYAGEWIALDPTLGQDVADVTHLKLIEGGLEESLKLVRYIGKISITLK